MEHLESKNNQGMIVAIVVVVIIALVSTGFFILQSQCKVDGTHACLDRDTGMFKLEENPKLTVQVESQVMADYLQTTWNTLHPAFANRLEIVVQPPLDLETMARGLPYDVMVTSQKNAVYFMEQLSDLGSGMDTVVGSRIPVQLQDSINVKGFYFVQNSIDGGLFVYNETLLKEMGFDLTDSDESGLPDAFDSWEAILSKRSKLFEKVDVIYPLTFVDQDSFYPFLTGGRWTLNFTKKGSDPGFDSQEFLDGLRLIQQISNEPLIKDNDGKPQDAASLQWDYDKALYERRTPFSYVTDFEMAQAYQKKTGDKYVYAPFPEFEKHRLAPMGEIDGYVVANSTTFPSAAAEVIRILRTPEAIEIYESPTQRTPVYHRSYFEELKSVDEERLSRIRAYNFHDTPPVMALDNNPSRLARSLYTEVDFMPVVRDLYDKKLSLEETQDAFIKLSESWLKENDVKAEENKES